MLKQSTKYTLRDKTQFVTQALHWADQFSHLAYFHHHDIAYPHGGFQQILAVGCEEEFIPSTSDRFEDLKAFHQDSWLFGYLGYDLKNDIEKLHSRNTDSVQFKDIAFFKARHILFFNGDEVCIESAEAGIFDQIQKTTAEKKSSDFGPVNASIAKSQYLQTVAQLRQHIEEGDCYEINFCQEFHGQLHQAHPLSLFLELSHISPKPFATYQKWHSQYLLCASPERFLQKKGLQLISQPIKGTRPRGKSAEEDQQLAHELRHDEKELAENMMIVDLVRNDLARSSESGSVKVEELFGIYSFQQVFQMISTVRSQLSKDVHFIDAIRHAFPMGSMTGAPKIKVMELIEQYEQNKRGVFSGAAGYITPAGDFDFNVIIRSLFLDLEKQLYSFQVGGAITYDSVPESEYEECLVKVSAIMSILGQKVDF